MIAQTGMLVSSARQGVGGVLPSRMAPASMTASSSALMLACWRGLAAIRNCQAMHQRKPAAPNR